MTPEAALIELLGRVGARLGESVTVSTEELNQWPAVAVSALKSQGLLLKARPAKSVVCPGCEQDCSMPVHTVTRPNATVATSFVVCDKRSDTNRVPVPAARLALWRCDAQAVCGFVASSLGSQPSAVQATEAGLLPIGMARGNKRTQMLCLRVQGHLALVVGTDAMPLADVIGFENGGFTLDRPVIHQMVDAATTADPRHTPSTASMRLAPAESANARASGAPPARSGAGSTTAMRAPGPSASASAQASARPAVPPPAITPS